MLYPRTVCPCVHAWPLGWQEKGWGAPCRAREDGEKGILHLKNQGAGKRLDVSVLTWTSPSRVSF